MNRFIKHLSGYAVVCIVLLQAEYSLAQIRTDTDDRTTLNRAMTTITAEALREYVKAVADDRMEGRAPASRGDRLAREYLPGRLSAGGCFPRAALRRAAA